MRLVMIMCPEGRRDQVAALVEQQGIQSVTELPWHAGKGINGERRGTGAQPDKSALLFTAVADEKKAELVAALRACEKNLFPGEGMKAFVLPQRRPLDHGWMATVNR